MQLTEEQKEKIKKLSSDFYYRIRNTLRIKNKEGGIVPFECNEVQRYIHEIIEEQKRETGRVRVLILKGRKQGCSTYVAARFFDRMMREEGLESFILAHRQDTSEALYDIVHRFYENYPDFKNDIICKQDITQKNAKRFTFTNNSGYTVGTAGKGEIGRGFTPQLLHLSEAAMYESGEKISAGIMKAVPDSVGTEVIIESTANGIGNFFHKAVMKARLNQGSFKLIFIPWFWQKEYRRPLPKDFKLREEEEIYKKTYGLDDEQMYWRRIEIEDFDDGIVQFRREYPATIEEAFDVSVEGSFFSAEDIDYAMNAEIPPGRHKVLCGLDVAGTGEKADRIVFALRAGRHHFKNYIFKGLKTEEVVLRAKEIIRHHKVATIFVDKGFNPAVCEFLERDFPSKTIGVFFGSAADESSKYLNKRAEMVCRVKKWIKDRPVKMVNSSNLKQEMLAIKKKESLNDPNQRIQIISKQEIRESIGVSTDEFDALALTFAYYVEDYEDIDESEMQEEQNINYGCRITGY